VKGNFIAGRTFHDDADLAEQCTAWLQRVNTERPSDATGQPPVERLSEEQRTFGTRPSTAQDYGFFDCVVVSREGLVAIETNRYSVPAHLIGRALTARLHVSRIDLFADQELVATHVRSQEQHARIVNPAHFEAAFRTKPRARVMVYRDWLCDLAPAVNGYVRDLCHKRRAEMKEQMIALYELAEAGRARRFRGSAGVGGGTADVRRGVCACDCEHADGLYAEWDDGITNVSTLALGANAAGRGA